MMAQCDEYLSAHRSKAEMGYVSTWMGERLSSTPGAVFTNTDQ